MIKINDEHVDKIFNFNCNKMKSKVLVSGDS